MFESIRNLTTTFLGLLVDVSLLTTDYIGLYLRFLLRSALVLGGLILAELLLVLVLLLMGNDNNWVYSTLSIIIAVEAAIFLFLAYPLLVASTGVRAKFPEFFNATIVQPTKIIAAVFFIGLMGGIFWSVTPFPENPGTVIRVLMILTAIGVGSYAGWVTLSPKKAKALVTGQLAILLVIAMLSAYFPETARSIGGLIQQGDQLLPELLDTPDALTVRNPDELQFVDTRTGESKIWYYKNDKGEFELYDQEGFHRTGLALELADTPIEREEIIANFEQRWAKSTQQVNTPKLIKNVTSETVFFDQSGKAIVYFYTASDGAIELFSGSGHHPTLGVQLEPITAEVVQAYKINENEQIAHEKSQQTKEGRDAYRKRYVNVTSIPQQGNVALLALAGKSDRSGIPTLPQGIGDIFTSSGYKTVDNAFTPLFCQSDLIHRVADGEKSILSGFQLPNSVKRIVLMSIDFTDSRSSGLDNILTVDGTAGMSVLDSEGNVLLRKQYSVPGAGVDERAAIQATTERLVSLAQKDLENVQ